MTVSANAIDNNVLAALSRQAGPHISDAIRYASGKTGVDFSYLMEQAAAESSFNAKAEASTSSATGLYQFIEKTWLHMVRDHGDKYGMADMAAQIDAKGNVTDPAVKEEILEMRKDPKKAALLAAEFASQNKRHLERYVEGEIGPTELYFAHFMGAGGATGFLNAMKKDPMTIGADIFPKEARANRNVFYDRKTGEPRTLAQIYDFFDKKFSGGTETSVATNRPAPATKTKTPHSITPLAFNKFPFQVTQEFTNSIPLQDKGIFSFLTSGLFGRDTSWGSHDPFFSAPQFLMQHHNLMLLAQQEIFKD